MQTKSPNPQAMGRKLPILVIILATFVAYLPIIVNPKIVLERGNDLEVQFLPVFNFVKQSFLENHTLPLWNTFLFSGMPLLPDPQFAIFYPPHFLFLVFSTNFAFLFLMLSHIAVGGIGAYFLAKKVLNLSSTTSLFSGLLYISMPMLANYIEAGHFGLVETIAWLPYIAIASLKIAKKPESKWSVLLAMSLAGTYFTHTLVFLISILSSFLLLMIALLTIQKKPFAKSLLLLGTSYVITFGLTAITLLPQIEWSSITTRFLLLNSPQVFPIWFSVKEFIITTLFPSFYKDGLQLIPTEKWTSLGLMNTLLALIGFFFLSNKLKLIIVGFSISVLIIVLNNASPFYTMLLSLSWFDLMRVSTRIWFLPTLIVVFLASMGLDALARKKINRKFIVFISLLALSEFTFLSWSRLYKPITAQEKNVPGALYEFLKSDSGKFRVFCLDRCLSPKKVAEEKIETIEGYNTLQQTNYFKESWQLMGGYWNYYTLAVPPIGFENFQKLTPDPKTLGEFNVKYVISPYQLENKDYTFVSKFDNYNVYLNNFLKPRAYFALDEQKAGTEAPVIKYTPNQVTVDTTKGESSRLVLSEVWSPGWEAFINGNEKVNVQEMPNTLRLVDLPANTNFVDFKYSPSGFNEGKTITIATLFLLLIWGIKSRFLKNYKLNNWII